MRKRTTKNEIALGPLTWAEIDLGAIAHNLKEIRRLAKRHKFNLQNRKPKHKLSIPPEILAVVKAEGYGHGMTEVACLLDAQGVEHFAVSDVAEGMALRKAGIKKPIVLFESTLPDCAKHIIEFDLTPTVCTFELADALNRLAKVHKKNIGVHVEVDTGMGRLGIWHEEVYDFVKELQKYMSLTVTGIYTHFPVADTDRDFTEQQTKQLDALVRRLDQSGLVVPFIHAANSMGLADYQTNILNLVRPGLMLYGVYPSPHLKKDVKLKPAMSIKSKIIFLKDVGKGRSISYGRTFIAKKKMTVATVPLGYSDGYPIALSNKASVLVGGIKCPVIGRVTMDQIVIDVSKVKQPKLGMEVVILGSQKGQTISADELANLSNTINYEILCRLGTALPRKYL